MLDHRSETFLTLYDEMNYRRTAEKLNMTQPGVTQHIQYLERYYGVKLFAYDGRTLRRTENAEQLKRYLDSLRTEELALRQSFLKSDVVSLRLGATKTIGEFVIVPQIKKFLANRHHALSLVVDNTAVLLSLLERAELDFAVIEGVFDKEKYGSHLFKKENFVGICAADHPFAGRVVSLEELFDAHLIVREKGSGTRRLLEQAVEERGYTLERFRRCSSISNFSVICAVVAQGDAVTFAYEPIVHSRADLTTFTVADMQIRGEFNYVYCSERVGREKIRQFLGEE
ncbi:MAG: LysR family transcriptional regulator [Oscillospiraceae bacterium]|nr:LysR family transcriptional regulator [Oscillospiraceae bacterium]